MRIIHFTLTPWLISVCCVWFMFKESVERVEQNDRKDLYHKTLITCSTTINSTISIKFCFIVMDFPFLPLQTSSNLLSMKIHSKENFFRFFLPHYRPKLLKSMKLNPSWDGKSHRGLCFFSIKNTTNQNYFYSHSKAIK